MVMPICTLDITAYCCDCNGQQLHNFLTLPSGKPTGLFATMARGTDLDDVNVQTHDTDPHLLSVLKFMLTPQRKLQSPTPQTDHAREREREREVH